MSNVLTDKSDVECNHKGTVKVSGVSRLTVSGNKVLLEAGVAKMTIVGCPIGSLACKTVGPFLTAGGATKLKVNGKAVILDSLSGTTVPSGTLSAKASQDKLTAI